jgi:phosphonopyruvate decarboxylase
MKAENFAKILNADFYTGVPDSQLKALCNYLMHTYGIDPKHHVIAANEGNCTALAAGYHLATGKVPVVYMQNSGEGNIINPVASLLNDKVYAIPMIFVIGWRGEPGIHDEPQHIYQGEVTLKLLEDMGIRYFVIGKDTTEEEVSAAMQEFRKELDRGEDVAFVIRKGALSYEEKVEYRNDNPMIREEIIRHIVQASGEDPIVSTTGKASRELFEIREHNGQSHKYDFLTVGSMGHSSSIALGVAVQKPGTKVWCVDGDGAAAMRYTEARLSKISMEMTWRYWAVRHLKIWYTSSSITVPMRPWAVCLPWQPIWILSPLQKPVATLMPYPLPPTRNWTGN